MAKFNTVSTFIISLVALIVSIANLIFVGQQTKTNKMLYCMQMEQVQPYYIITTSLEKDSTDGVYGTEHLKIFNRGYTNVSSVVTDIVVFELCRVQRGVIDTIRLKYVIISTQLSIVVLRMENKFIILMNKEIIDTFKAYIGMLSKIGKKEFLTF